MNRKIIYPALLLALSAPVNAADRNEVESVRKYVIENAKPEQRLISYNKDLNVPCNLYRLILDGSQIGIIPPNGLESGIAYKNPLDPSKNPKIQSSQAEFLTLVCPIPTVDNLAVAAIDNFDVEDLPQVSEVTMMRDGIRDGDSYKPLDGLVDTAYEGRRFRVPAQHNLQEVLNLQEGLTRVDLGDTQSRNRIQILYDQLISGAYNLITKK